MKLIGIFGFEESIALKAECLNRKIQINIDNFKGRLLTPTLPKDFSGKSDDYRPLIQPKSIISFNEHLKWGRPYLWPSGDSALINFMLEIEIDEKFFDDKQKELLIDSTETWIKRLKNNFYSFDYLLEYKGVNVKSSSYLGFDYYSKSKGQKTEKIKSNRSNLIEINVLDNAIDFKTLKNVLRSTSQNKSLCDEYKLIKNSQIALQDNEYRKSIFDSASGLELCFTNILLRELNVNNDKLKTKILSQNKSIQSKFDLLEAINIDLPFTKTEYNEGISMPRNRAIHAGKNVNKEQAYRAFDIAKTSLDKLIKNKLS
jgi:hypothetical protein